MNTDGYFKFKNIDSRDMGVLISSMPNITKPQRRIEEVVIPGRNGSLTIDEETYESYTLTFECGMRDIKNIDSLLAWLDGGGELIISTEPDKVYKARVSNAIPISDIIYLYSSFVVSFTVHPLKGSVNKEDDLLEIKSSPVIIHSKGTYPSEPVITVYGTGYGMIGVNGIHFELGNIEDYVTINCEIQEVYKNDENRNNYFSSENGLFPSFKIGENVLEFMGNVEKIEVQPNWRWI